MSYVDLQDELLFDYTRRFVHERKHFIPITLINDIIYKWSGEIGFLTKFIQIHEINSYTNCSLLFLHADDLNPIELKEHGI